MRVVRQKADKTEACRNVNSGGKATAHECIVGQKTDKTDACSKCQERRKTFFMLHPAIFQIQIRGGGGGGTTSFISLYQGGGGGERNKTKPIQNQTETETPAIHAVHIVSSV